MISCNNIDEGINNWKLVNHTSVSSTYTYKASAEEAFSYFERSEPSCYSETGWMLCPYTEKSEMVFYNDGRLKIKLD